MSNVQALFLFYSHLTAWRSCQEREEVDKTGIIVLNVPPAEKAELLGRLDLHS
jgi:hypothetical protein